MRSEDVTSLREAGVSLIDCDHRTPPATNVGYPYVTIPHLVDGRLRLEDVRLISRSDFVEWTRKARPRHHDVILSRRCNPGETAVVPPELECALGQNLVLLRSDGSRVLPEFLRWLVRGPEWWEQVAKFINVGAVFDSLKCADIPNFRLRIPSTQDQGAIAGLLGALDDKIELNRQMNETLEAMARALFKSWFVDFERIPPTPVAELLERKLLDVGDGYRATNSELAPPGGPGLPFARAGDVDNGIALEMADVLRIDRVSAVAGSKLSRGYDVAFTSKGTVGRLAFLSPSTPQFVYSPQLCFWRSLDFGRLSPFVLYQWMDSRYFDEQVDRVKAQTDMAPYVSLRDQRRMTMHVPPADAQAAIAQRLHALQARRWHNKAESETLAQLRDLLLPKLLSGELRIRDAERAVEAVL